MHVTQGWMSWKGVNIATPHLSAQESNINLTPDRPPDGQNKNTICKDFVVCCDTWDVWQVFNRFSTACLWSNIVGLKRVPMQLCLAYQLQNLTSAWREISLQMAKKWSTFIKILSCSVTSEAPNRCSINPIPLNAYVWGLWIFKYCQCSSISPVSARI